VNPITIQEARNIEQLSNACCVLHSIIFYYNGADNWNALVSQGTGSCEAGAADEIAIIEKDFSYIHVHN
jgi:hypothetical protein